MSERNGTPGSVLTDDEVATLNRLYDPSAAAAIAKRRSVFVLSGGAPQGGLGEYLDNQVYPQLTAEAIYTDPAHQWHKSADDKWRGGCPWHESKSGTSFVVTPRTLQWHCAGCAVGGGPTQYLHKLAGGQGTPHGEDLDRVAEELCQRAGVRFPARQYTPAQQEQHRRLESRRAVLASVILICQQELWEDAATSARAYMTSRGFSEDDMKDLGLGYYPSVRSMAERLRAAGHTDADIREAAVIHGGMAGYIVFPWLDDRGQPQTLCATWPSRDLPPGTPKKQALPNPEDKNGKDWYLTKCSPYCFDRAKAARHQHLVLVEGITDAALAQVRGDTRVVACVGGNPSIEQVKTLQRNKVASVTIALDPDKAGDANMTGTIHRLAAAGIAPYAAPRLPEGMDPDEYIIEHGIDAWKAHTERRTHGFHYLAERILAEHGPRRDGDHSWGDDLVDRAIAEARKLPSDKPDVITRHFLTPIGEALEVGMDDLRRRLWGPAADAVGADGAAEEQVSGFCWEPLDSEAFFREDYRPRWLVKRLIVARQPLVIGGAFKTLKTSLMIDLAVGLASGRPFLGSFEVYQPVRVAILSGESGPFTLQETARRIARARGIDEPHTLDIRWQFTLPCLANGTHLDAIRAGLERDKIDVVFVDPLYLTLLSGVQDLSASNLYQTGPLLLAVARTCIEAGATPVLLHHATKANSRSREPLELGDLAYSGIAEFARQWLLISRREAFAPGQPHQLWLAGGGSCGQGGLWSIDVDEGDLSEDFSGRGWEVTVRQASEARELKKEESDLKKDRNKKKTARDDEQRFMTGLDDLDKSGTGASIRQIRIVAGLNPEKAEGAAFRLCKAGLIEKVPEFSAPRGRAGAQGATGYRRVRDNDES